MIVFADNAYAKGRRICEKLKENIPAHCLKFLAGGRGRQGHCPRDSQGHAQGRVGQVLRRRHHPQKKLLEKQKEGKKKMRQLGSVTLPSEAFTAVLKLDSDS